MDPGIADQFEQWLATVDESEPWCATVSFVNPHDVAWWRRTHRPWRRTHGPWRAVQGLIVGETPITAPEASSAWAAR